MSKQTRETWMQKKAAEANGSATQATLAMRAEVLSVTPEMARKWLENEDRNQRPSSKERVASYARDMTAGLWHLNGQPIQFDVNGAMINGGHRLRAVVRANCAVPMLIVWNAEREGIDRGRGRSATDERRMRGEPCSRIYLSAIKTLRRIERDDFGISCSDNDCYEIEREYPESTAWLQEHAGSRGNATMIGAIAFTVPGSGTRAAEFLELVRSLANLEPRSAAHNFTRQLRNFNTAGQQNMRALSMLTLQAMRNHVLGIEGEYIKAASEALAYWKKNRLATL